MVIYLSKCKLYELWITFTKEWQNNFYFIERLSEISSFPYLKNKIKKCKHQKLLNCVSADYGTVE